MEKLNITDIDVTKGATTLNIMTFNYRYMGEVVGKEFM